MRVDRDSSDDVEFCLSSILVDLRMQHELAKRLDAGPLRRPTLRLLECSLETYRVISGKRRRRKS